MGTIILFLTYMWEILLTKEWIIVSITVTKCPPPTLKHKEGKEIIDKLETNNIIEPINKNMTQVLTIMRRMKRKRISLKLTSKSHRYQKVMVTLRLSSKISQEGIIIKPDQDREKEVPGEQTEIIGQPTKPQNLIPTTDTLIKDKVPFIYLT